MHAEVFGPAGSIVLRLALDTGATATMISAGPLTAVGYDPSLAAGRIQVTTGSGVVFVPRIEVIRLSALGHNRRAFPVLSHTLASSAGIDGLLGLDFVRGYQLTVNFKSGQLGLRR